MTGGRRRLAGAAPAAPVPGADGPAPLRSLVVASADDGGACEIALLALGPDAARAADELFAGGIDGLAVRAGPARGGEACLLTLVLLGGEAVRREELEACLDLARQASPRVVVAAGARVAARVAAVSAARGPAVTVVTTPDEAGALAGLVRAYVSPLLRAGSVGFDFADLEALLGEGRTGRIARWPMGDWAEPSCEASAVASLLAPFDEVGACRGLLVTIFADPRDPGFTLHALDRWVSQLHRRIGAATDLRFAVHDQPGPAHAMVTAFFGAEGR